MARDVNGIVAGVGLLLVAPEGTSAPTDATTALPAAWREVGYTESGATINRSIETENLEVAEELAPVGVTSTSQTGSVAFEMAQATADNLALALNLGANYTVASGGYIDPPDPANEVYISLVLNTSQGARWYFPRVKNTAEFSMARAKTGKTLIGVEMGIFQATSKPFFRVWPNTQKQV